MAVSARVQGHFGRQVPIADEIFGTERPNTILGAVKVVPPCRKGHVPLIWATRNFWRQSMHPGRRAAAARRNVKKAQITRVAIDSILLDLFGWGAIYS